MNAASWGVVGVVIAAALGYLGARYTAQSSKRASQYSAALSAPESISSGYDRLNDDLWRTLADVRTELTATREELAQLRTDVEAAQARQQRQYRASIAYIRELLSLITIHAPHVRLPQPPPELAEDVRVVEGKEPT